MPIRARYSQPPSIAERSWAIFTAYYYESRTLEDIAANWRLSPDQVRRIITEVDAQLGRARVNGAGFLAPESPVEDLDLSVRTRNSLHGLGCHTIEDVLRLDLSSSLRGVGHKTRQELIVKLQRAGFSHPAQASPASEMRTLERSLERIEGRIGAALGTLAKEVRLLRQRLRKKQTEEKLPSTRYSAPPK